MTVMLVRTVTGLDVAVAVAAEGAVGGDIVLVSLVCTDITPGVAVGLKGVVFPWLAPSGRLNAVKGVAFANAVQYRLVAKKRTANGMVLIVYLKVL